MIGASTGAKGSQKSRAKRKAFGPIVCDGEHLSDKYMLRLISIAIISFVLFFPTYWAWHYLFGEDVGATLSLLTCIILYPYLLGSVWKAYPPIDVVPIDCNDEFNVKCIERARSEIHRLECGLNEGKKDAFVKYSIRYDEESADHVWGIAHSMTDGYVVVGLINEPVYSSRKDCESDPRDKILLGDIQDWMLVDKDGNCEGGYTHLAILNAYKRLHGKVPKKYLRGLKQFVDINVSEYA